MQPKCPNCNGNSFDSKSYTPASEYQTLELIYCTNCGAVLGGNTWNPDAGTASEVLDAIEGVADDVGRVKHNVGRLKRS